MLQVSSATVSLFRLFPAPIVGVSSLVSLGLAENGAFLAYAHCSEAPECKRVEPALLQTGSTI